jgi:hypothetical protein
MDEEEPLAKRTRASSSSSSSTSKQSEEPTVSRHRKSSRGSVPVYNELDLDECILARRNQSRHNQEIKNAANFEGYCPRHGNSIDEIVLRPHNHDDVILACYCPDDLSATTFDVVVSEVANDLGIAKETIAYWVSWCVYMLLPPMHVDAMLASPVLTILLLMHTCIK